MTARRPPEIIELAGWGQIKAVRELIKKGYDCNGRKVDVNERDYCGSCAVMRAIDSNNLEILKILVDEGGAELDTKDHLGRPALFRARELKHNKVAEWIEQKFAQKKIVQHASQKPTATTMIPSVNAPSVFSKPHGKDESKDYQQTRSHDPKAPGEAMSVYLSDPSCIILDYLDGDVISYWQGDKETKNFSSKVRQQFTLLGKKAKDLPKINGSLKASRVANLILRGKEKNIEEAITLVRKNPDLLRLSCIATDPLNRRVQGTPLQIAAMAGDIDLQEGITDPKKRGAVEQLIAVSNLSKEEIAEQLTDIEIAITGNAATQENEKRNERVLNAIKTFGEGIFLKAKEYKGNNFRELQAHCQPLIEQLEKDLTPDPNEVIKSGYIFDPAILQKAGQWFEDNVDLFGGWWGTIQSHVFGVNGFGKLQSKLSARDAQVVRAGIGHLIKDKIIPARTTLKNSGGSSHFDNPTFKLGLNYCLGYNGNPGWCGTGALGWPGGFGLIVWKTYVDQQQQRYKTYAASGECKTELTLNNGVRL